MPTDYTVLHELITQTNTTKMAGPCRLTLQAAWREIEAGAWLDAAAQANLAADISQVCRRDCRGHAAANVARAIAHYGMRDPDVAQWRLIQAYNEFSRIPGEWHNYAICAVCLAILEPTKYLHLLGQAETLADRACIKYACRGDQESYPQARWLLERIRHLLTMVNGNGLEARVSVKDPPSQRSQSWRETEGATLDRVGSPSQI